MWRITERASIEFSLMRHLNPSYFDKCGEFLTLKDIEDVKPVLSRLSDRTLIVIMCGKAYERDENLDKIKTYAKQAGFLFLLINRGSARGVDVEEVIDLQDRYSSILK